VSADGRTLYVAAMVPVRSVSTIRMRSSRTFYPNEADQIQVSGGGPTGLALDERRGRLYVLTASTMESPWSM